MRHGLATSGFERQAGLSTIQGLDLTLLIEAKHHGMLGRIQIQTDNILQFLRELAIVADLDQMGLQTVGSARPLPLATRCASDLPRAPEEIDYVLVLPGLTADGESMQWLGQSAKG